MLDLLWLHMRYYDAVKLGEQVAARAQMILSRYTGTAITAMFVKETKDGWIPVGEENLYVVIRKDENLCVIGLCDGDGFVKAMSNLIPCAVAKTFAEKLEKDGFKKYEGPLVLPI